MGRSLGIFGTGLLALLLGGALAGEATWALRAGASREDPGTFSRSNRHRIAGRTVRSERARWTYGDQQVLGVVVFTVGVFMVGGNLLLPRLLGSADD